jgi:pyridoxamine 5'-phosphate oxidase-like protein
MVIWSEFADAAPDIASAGRRLIDASDDGKVLLATVRGDDLPRIHPITMAIVDGRLYAFIIARSPKKLDLELDGRYALHTHLDPAAPTEVALRGRARLVDAPDERERVAVGWAFEVDDDYTLFEFSIEHALLGDRATANDWPPVYTSWHATAS